MTEPTPHALDTLTGSLSLIDPTDTISAAGRKVVLADAIRLLALEDGVRTSDDPEFIHDMRVATRRMRSMLRLLGGFYREKPVRKLSRSLRWLARRLGAVRDLDVLIADLKQRDPEGTSGPLVAAQNHRSEAHARLIGALDSEKFGVLTERLVQFALDSDDRLADAAPLPVQVRHVVPVLLHEQLAAVRGFAPLIDDHAQVDYETLHALRIAFKRLRYATAYFTGVLGATAADFVTEIKAVQDHLGRLNDTVVFARYLERHAEAQPDDRATADAIADLRRETRLLAKSFVQVWHRFNSRAVQRHLADALLVLR